MPCVHTILQALTSNEPDSSSFLSNGPSTLLPWPFPGKPFGLPFFLGVAVVRSCPAIRNSRSHLTRGIIAGDFHPNRCYSPPIRKKQTTIKPKELRVEPTPHHNHPACRHCRTLLACESRPCRNSASAPVSALRDSLSPAWSVSAFSGGSCPLIRAALCLIIRSQIAVMVNE